jgi:hypothetical protein
MPFDILQSSTQSPLPFFMVQSSDHITGATGLSPTVTIRKPGGSFAAPSGAVTEIASGWYQVAGNATDTNTLGPLLLHATGAGADPCDIVVANIVAYNPQDSVRAGLTALPNTACTTNASLITSGTGTDQLSVSGGNAKADVAKINGISTSSVTTVNANIGATQPVNFTGTGASALVKSDMVDVAGAAVSTSSAQLGVNLVQLNGSASAASNLSKSTDAMARSTVTTGATTTSIPTSACSPAGAVSDQFKGRIITFDGNTATAALRGQSTDITANTNAANPTFTVTALTTAPASGDTFTVT